MYLPQYLSYSQVSRYEECPRSWYLSYVKGSLAVQTWFFPVGTVVHQSIEHFLEHGDVPRFESLFYPLISDQMRVQPYSEWLHAGSKEDPVIGQKAVELGKRCVDNAITFLEDVDVEHIEYEATNSLPGCEVPIKAFVDILGEHKKHGPCIIDWKTGKRKPTSNFQLETYAALLAPPFGEMKYVTGLWGMLNPEASKARKIDLSSVSPAEVGARYQRAYEGMKKKVYAATPKSNFTCDFCVMKLNCQYAVGPTKRALFYDKADTEGYPF